MTDDSLANSQVLVVEDEMMVAMLLEDYLADMGAQSLHADSVENALELIASNRRIDMAVLDMNLHGKSVRPVAQALAGLKIPFCFMSGYGAGAVAGFPAAPTVAKPFNADTFKGVIAKLAAEA